MINLKLMKNLLNLKIYFNIKFVKFIKKKLNNI